MTIEDTYTTLKDVKEELKKRWNDKGLKEKIEGFIGGDIPDFLCDSPKACLVRHISTPNFEFFKFKELVDDLGIDYILTDFVEDRFSSQNSSKYHVARIFFDGGKGKKGGRKIESKMLIDFNKAGNKELNKIKTINDEFLVDFHHNMLISEIPETKSRIKDLSKWLKKRGDHPKDFYVHFLALFIMNGILFENYLLNDEEKEITENIILPAIEKLHKIFNLKPLIVRLLPKDSENDPRWFYYTDSFKKYVK
jgi:hypothetical protein